MLFCTKLLRMNIITTYGISTLVFFALDMLWLGLVAKNFYRSKLGHLMAENVVWPAAIVFYLLYIAGIVYFAVNPALKAGNWQLALLNGALLGGLCYATYDLTNMATLSKWPWEVVVVDILWGIVLTATVSVVAYFGSNALR